MRLFAAPEIRPGGAPRQEVAACAVPPVLGLMASDYPGLRLRAAVAPGDRVEPGQPLMAEREAGGLVVPSPAAGVVETVEAVSRTQARLVTLKTEGGLPPLQVGRGGDLVGLLLKSGLWAGFLERPFGRVPSAEARPDAIFVTAIDTEPNAADVPAILSAEAAAFAAGVAAIAGLTDGPVFVCQAPGAPLAPEGGRVRAVGFAGPHPAGLPGTHVERLFPVLGGRRVWQIDWPEVLAIGHAVETGTVPADRVVALGGPATRDPRLVRLPTGADIEALAAEEGAEGPRRALSGSALSGRPSRFLRRRDRQITLLRPQPGPSPTLADRVFRGPSRRAPIIPHAALARALPPGFAVLPLLRALSVGDADAAERLGVAGLLEEDMALAGFLSGGAEDFAGRLRKVLDTLEARA